MSSRMYKTLTYSFTIGVVFSLLLIACGQAPGSVVTPQSLQSTEVQAQTQVTEQPRPSVTAPATSLPTAFPTEDLIPTVAPSALPTAPSEGIRDKLIGKWQYVMTQSNGQTTTDSLLKIFDFSDTSTLELTAIDGQVIKAQYNLSENDTVLQLITERATMEFNIFIEGDRLILTEIDNTSKTEYIYERIK
jgi:hypothetical protein